MAKDWQGQRGVLELQEGTLTLLKEGDEGQTKGHQREAAMQSDPEEERAMGHGGHCIICSLLVEVTKVRTIHVGAWARGSHSLGAALGRTETAAGSTVP